MPSYSLRSLSIGDHSSSPFSFPADHQHAPGGKFDQSQRKEARAESTIPRRDSLSQTDMGTFREPHICMHLLQNIRLTARQQPQRGIPADRGPLVPLQYGLCHRLLEVRSPNELLSGTSSQVLLTTKPQQPPR